MLPTFLTVPNTRPAPRRSRGFGLLQVLLLISVMAGLATMGYLQWRERAAVESSRQERQVLAQADQAIVAFATVMRRLPCPDTNRDGEEDCGNVDAQKGWLPSVTLRLAGADPGVDVGQLRYLVQRGADANNLTTLTDTWRPLAYDDSGETFSSMQAGSYPSDILTLTDLCQRLETARTTPLGPLQARVNAAPLRSVAYALAHPGNTDADGDGDVFDGANSNAAANANLMEDPARRPLLATYNDLVLERSFTSLQADFHCRPLIDSINTVALGHDVVSQVAQMRDDNIEAAGRAVAFSTLATIMTGLEIALAVAEGISDAGNAAAEWVICAASLGLAVNACAAAPQHTAAIALAGGVVYANIAAAVLNATAAGIAAGALVLASNTATPDQACPPRDTSLLTQSLVSAQAELASAASARLAVETEVANKTIELNTAIAERDAAVATLVNVVRGGAASSQLDGQVNQLIVAAGGWGTASYTRDATESRLTQAIKERDLWAAEVAKYNAMLADTAGTIARLTSEIAALDALIATNPPNKAALMDQRAGKAAELKLAQDTAGLTAVRDKAAASLATAQAALDSATAARDAAVTSFSTAQTSYQTAYANLVNGAARYAVYNGSGQVIGYRCTTACQSGDTSISGALNSALVDLFGPAASSSPSPDAKYLRPIKVQKELDALNTKLAAAQKRESQAQYQVDQLQQMINNPAACNSTGTAVVPMTPDQAQDILVEVDRKGGTR
jgi:type II secretory pathway pseudopilin PulG